MSRGALEDVCRADSPREAVSALRRGKAKERLENTGLHSLPLAV